MPSLTAAPAVHNYLSSVLSHALLARPAAPMVDCTRWLRSALVARGMCSEHLAEHDGLDRSMSMPGHSSAPVGPGRAPSP